MPNLRHFDSLGTARFVTFTCYQRHRYLSHPDARQAVLMELQRLRQNYAVKILGYVIMPEHVHLILLPPDDLKPGKLIGRMKALSANSILKGLRGRPGLIRCRPNGQPAVWQRRCYDHNCRSAEAVLEKLDYRHKNPVARGLVSHPGDWPWLSYNWYYGRSGSEFEIDGVEL